MLPDSGISGSKSSDVFDNLPLKIEDRTNLCQKNPRFVDLIERVSQKLEPNGRSRVSGGHLSLKFFSHGFICAGFAT